MKVAIIAEWIDAWRGGAETSTLQFIHHLMERGIDVHVFTRSRPSPTPGLWVHTVGGAAMSRTRRSVTFAHRIQRRLQEESYDIVHAITPCKGADIYQPRGGTVAETVDRNIALVQTKTGRTFKRCANHFNFKQRYQLRIEREILAQPTGPVVVAISDYVIRQLKRHYALADERIRKIYNGVDPDTTESGVRRDNRAAIRKELGFGQNDYLVLLVAHNFRLKGVGWWMQALAKIRQEGADGIRSVVVGKGDSERWHALSARLGISDILTFAGPSDRVPAFRHAADVLVHPSFYDPCSRVVLEAMSAGLACVTSRWDGASEMVKDGETGFVLEDPSDVASLADRVKRLQDPQLREKFGKAGQEAVASVSMSAHCREMVCLYETLLCQMPAQ